MSLNAPLSAIEARIVDAVTEAVVATVERIGGIAPSVLPATSTHDSEPELIGIISFVGNLTWSVSWGFGAATGEKLSRTFTGMEFDFDSSDMGDVAAELVNVLAGDVVAQAQQRGISVQMSLPTVARGTAVEFVTDRNGLSVRRQFDSTMGQFWVVTTIRPENSRPRMPGRTPSGALQSV